MSARAGQASLCNPPGQQSHQNKTQPVSPVPPCFRPPCTARSIRFAVARAREGIIDFVRGSELKVAKGKRGHLLVVSQQMFWSRVEPAGWKVYNNKSTSTVFCFLSFSPQTAPQVNATWRNRRQTKVVFAFDGGLSLCCVCLWQHRRVAHFTEGISTIYSAMSLLLRVFLLLQQFVINSVTWSHQVPNPSSLYCHSLNT